MNSTVFIEEEETIILPTATENAKFIENSTRFIEDKGRKTEKKGLGRSKSWKVG
jgi:hypothetical protein